MKYVHLVEEDLHQTFLEENRKDPITGEPIKAGDHIVMCAVCKSAFLEDSWNYLGQKHCGQEYTLSEIPTYRKLAIENKPQHETIFSYRRIQQWERIALVTSLILNFVFFRFLYFFVLFSEIPWYSIPLLLVGITGFFTWRNLGVKYQEFEMYPRHFKVVHQTPSFVKKTDIISIEEIREIILMPKNKKKLTFMIRKFDDKVHEIPISYAYIHEYQQDFFEALAAIAPKTHISVASELLEYIDFSLIPESRQSYFDVIENYSTKRLKS